MQGTQVWSLIQEDSTCQVGMKPVGQNYWAHALEHTNRTYWAHVPGVPALQQEKPPHEKPEQKPQHSMKTQPNEK